MTGTLNPVQLLKRGAADALDTGPRFPRLVDGEVYAAVPGGITAAKFRHGIASELSTDGWKVDGGIRPTMCWPPNATLAVLYGACGLFWLLTLAAICFALGL